MREIIIMKQYSINTAIVRFFLYVKKITTIIVFR